MTLWVKNLTAAAWFTVEAWVQFPVGLYDLYSQEKEGTLSLLHFFVIFYCGKNAHNVKLTPSPILFCLLSF